MTGEEMANMLATLWDNIVDGAEEEYLAETAQSVFGSADQMEKLNLYYDPAWFN